MEYFDESQNPLKIYFMEKIQSLCMLPMRQTVQTKRSSLEAVRHLSLSGDDPPKHNDDDEQLTKSLMPINQIKNIRYKKFELEQKLSVKKNDVDVEENVKDYPEQMAENQSLINENLERQKVEFLRKLQQRKEKSLVGTSQLRNL